MENKKEIAFQLLNVIENLWKSSGGEVLTAGDRLDIAKQLIHLIREIVSEENEVNILNTMWHTSYPQLTTTAHIYQQYEQDIKELGRLVDLLQKHHAEVIAAPKPQTRVSNNGYSKNGKRLGRPPRKNDDTDTQEQRLSPEDIAPFEQAITSTNTVDPPPQEENKSPKATSSQSVSEAQEAPEAKAEVKSSPAPLSETTATEHSLDELVESLKYGKEYPLDAVYLVNNQYVRTKRLLRGAAGIRPIGVIIPYRNQECVNQIIIYFEDEHAIIPLETAKKYAHQRIKPYYDRRWRIMTNRDQSIIHSSLDTVNQMCRAMGGDKLEGEYADGPYRMFGDKCDLKIRYVCDIAYNS